MMGTLGAVLTSKKIEASPDRYRAEVLGDIEDVNGVLKITRIHVNYFLKVDGAMENAAKESLNAYLQKCPGAQSVMGCIEITHALNFE
jgi:organic hydroperoxide reductase OsmC/OhrA